MAITFHAGIPIKIGAKPPQNLIKNGERPVTTRIGGWHNFFGKSPVVKSTSNITCSMAKRKFFHTKKAKILLGFFILLLVFRIALPWIILKYANHTLSTMSGYYGHVNDVDVALLRGAYTLDSFYLNKVDDRTQNQTAFMSAQMVDLSLEWGALLKGKLVGELVFDRPNLRFTEDKVELDDVSKDTSDFIKLLEDFMPVKVNRCEIRNGNLEYIDQTRSPALHLSISHLYGEALNLRNAYSSDEILPATIDVTGKVNKGDLKFAMKLNPLAVRPAFDLNTEMVQTDLVYFNNFFKAYGGFDVNAGQMNIFAEAAAKDGKFIGYVKPIIRDLDVVSWKGQDKNDSFLRKIWESVVGGTGKLLHNRRKDQIATKINFEGDIDNPKANYLQSVVFILQNAFVKALQPSIDNQINLDKLVEDKKEKGNNFLDKIFKKD